MHRNAQAHTRTLSHACTIHNTYRNGREGRKRGKEKGREGGKEGVKQDPSISVFTLL